MNSMNGLRFSVLVIALLPITMSPVDAQMTMNWERLLRGDDGLVIGGITQLRNGNYLTGYIAGDYSNQIRYISEIGVNGALLRTTYPPFPAGYSYFESIEINQVLTTCISGDDSSSFGILTYPTGIILLSQPVLGRIESIHQYLSSSYIASSDFDDNGIILCRYDDNGTILWTYTDHIGQFTHTNDVCAGVTGIIYLPVSGFPNLVIETFDPDGNLMNVYDYQNSTFLHDIEMLPDGNLFITGELQSTPGIYDIAQILSPDGDIIRSLLPPDIDNGQGEHIVLMPDGGYLIATVVLVQWPPVSALVRFTRLDAAGNQLWQDDYSNSNADYDYMAYADFKLLVDNNGDVLLFGAPSNAEPPGRFVFLSKFTPDPTDLQIAVHPYGDVSVVPAPGRFFWHGTLTNNTDADITTDIWVIVRGPDGYPSEPLRVWEEITVPANGVYEADLRQNVPADAASGEYNYIVRAGTYDPDNPQHTIQAYFPLTVTGGTSVNLDPPRTRGVVAAPFEGPEMVEISPELNTTD